MALTRKGLSRQDHMRTKILRLWCSGYTQIEIGEMLSIKPERVGNYLGKIREEWATVREEGNEQFELERNEHVAKLENLYRESMMAWERSREPAIDTSKEKSTEGSGGLGMNVPDKLKLRRRRRQRDGDPRFLAQANDCLDKIAKIKGVYASEVRKGIEARAEKQRAYIHTALGNDHTRELLAQLTDAMGGMLGTVAGKAAAGGAMGGAAGAVLGQQMNAELQPWPLPALVDQPSIASPPELLTVQVAPPSRELPESDPRVAQARLHLQTLPPPDALADGSERAFCTGD